MIYLNEYFQPIDKLKIMKERKTPAEFKEEPGIQDVDEIVESKIDKIRNLSPNFWQPTLDNKEFYESIRDYIELPKEKQEAVMLQKIYNNYQTIYSSYSADPFIKGLLHSYRIFIRHLKEQSFFVKIMKANKKIPDKLL